MEKSKKNNRLGIIQILFLLLTLYFYYLAFRQGWGYEAAEKIMMGTLMLIMAFGYKKVMWQKIVAIIFAIVFLISFWWK